MQYKKINEIRNEYQLYPIPENNVCANLAGLLYSRRNSQIEKILRLSIAIKEDCLLSEVNETMVAKHGKAIINDRNGNVEQGWTTYYYKDEPLFGEGPLDIKEYSIVALQIEQYM